MIRKTVTVAALAAAIVAGSPIAASAAVRVPSPKVSICKFANVKPGTVIVGHRPASLYPSKGCPRVPSPR